MAFVILIPQLHFQNYNRLGFLETTLNLTTQLLAWSKEDSKARFKKLKATLRFLWFKFMAVTSLDQNEIQ
jgi:hypothetical protein